MADFTVEERVRLSAKEFIRLNSALGRRTRWIRLLSGLVVGTACLMWSYTFLLGVAVLLLIIVASLSPKLLMAGAAQWYRDLPFLREELLYGVSSKFLWVKGKTLEAKCTWENLDVWDEREGWLILRPYGLPSLYFRISRIHDSGVYEDLISQAKRHGRRYTKRRTRTAEAA